MTVSKIVLSGTLQGNRKLEVFCVAVVACSIIAGTFSFVIWRHNRLPDYSDWCGPDNPLFSININGAVPTGDGYMNKGGLYFPAGTFWRAENASLYGCPCSIKPCIRKCCPAAQIYNGGECTYSSTRSDGLIRKFLDEFGMIDSITNPIFQNIKENDFFYIYGDTVSRNKTHRIPMKGKDYLMTDGRIVTIENNVPKYTDQSQYCFEAQNGDPEISIFERSDEYEEPYWLKYVKACCMLISMPFFLITFFVYAALPSLRNLHGKSLMCFLACLMISYTTVPINNLAHHEFVNQPAFCNILAYMSQFSSLAAFFWLNVMCFDIWWVFSGYSHCHAKGVAARKAESKRFIIYSTYAWGGTLFISCITAFMDLVPAIPIDYIKPYFGVDKCWFYEQDEEILYFFLPVMVLLCACLIMFGMTGRRLRALSGNSRVINREEIVKEGLYTERRRYDLYLKLLAVMGLNWIMEVASVLVGSYLVWLVTDVMNALQGLAIFYLFICKRRILDLLRERFCPEQEYHLSNDSDESIQQPSPDTDKTEEIDTRRNTLV